MPFPLVHPEGMDGTLTESAAWHDSRSACSPAQILCCYPHTPVLMSTAAGPPKLPGLQLTKAKGRAVHHTASHLADVQAAAQVLSMQTTPHESRKTQPVSTLPAMFLTHPGSVQRPLSCQQRNARTKLCSKRTLLPESDQQGAYAAMQPTQWCHLDGACPSLAPLQRPLWQPQCWQCNARSKLCSTCTQSSPLGHT